MKINTRDRYSLQLMLHLHQLSRDGKPVKLKEIADRSDISRRYLEQLVIALKNAHLVRGRPGRGGGYFLARPAEEIKVRDILHASSGPMSLVDCVVHGDECVKSDYCSCRVLYVLIQQGIEEVLGRYSLADLGNDAWLEEHRRTILESQETESPE